MPSNFLNPKEVIEQVKTSVRIQSNKESILEEIDSLIESCKKDLKLAGVEKIDLADKYTLQAVRLYAKANYTYNSNDNKRFQESYDMIKRSMALSQEYKLSEE